MKERILVAMSGGVDSSVAAAILHHQGYQVVGVTLHLWDAQGEQKVGRCCSAEDREDARRTCDQLGVPHYVVDEREAFANHVVDPFVDAYAAGQTPTPCVACNQHVKLTRLIELADRWGASYLATGHYARIERAEGQPVQLLRGVDRSKDQSYFLFGVPKAVLARLCCPLGGMTKDEVRALGRSYGLVNADKPDSQQLCFVPDGRVGEFVSQRKQSQPGAIVDQEGVSLASHSGVQNFTVGQRRGLGFASGQPRYVLKIIPESQEVIVGPEAALYQSRLQAIGATWVHGSPKEPFRGQVRIRYRHTPADAWIYPKHDRFEVVFDEQQRAIAKGQAAVVYQSDQVLAGGYIV